MPTDAGVERYAASAGLLDPTHDYALTPCLSSKIDPARLGVLSLAVP